MKIALIIWNVVLTAGLAYLIFMKSGAAGKESAGMNASAKMKKDSVQAGTIAFVNMDTLENHYELFAQKKKEMQQKQNDAEDLLNKKMSDFQNDYTAAQQSASTMTQSQLDATQQKLQQKQSDIQQLQDKLQTDFQKQLQDINEELQDSLDSFIKNYNADKHFSYILSYTSGGSILYGEPGLDITKDVIDGMNSRMKKK
ncbi:MAG: OmpH family outer membrane protein [Chitinophagales bacterium]